MNELFVIADMLTKYAKENIVIDSVRISQKTFDSIRAELSLHPIIRASLVSPHEFCEKIEKGLSPTINGIPLTVVNDNENQDEASFWSKGSMVGCTSFSS